MTATFRELRWTAAVLAEIDSRQAVDQAYELAIWWAIAISRDIETCERLIRGEPVDPARLDPAALELAAEFQLVRMDMCAIDLLHPRVGLRSLLKQAA